MSYPLYLQLGGGQVEAFLRAPDAEGGLDEFAGVYDCAELGTTYQLSINEGCLDLDINGSGGKCRYTGLRRVARDSFLMDNLSEGQAVLWFARDSGDHVERLVVSGARAQGLVFTRRKDETGVRHAKR